jgi:hypothetical protein
MNQLVKKVSPTAGELSGQPVSRNRAEGWKLCISLVYRTGWGRGKEKREVGEGGLKLVRSI